MLYIYLLVASLKKNISMKKQFLIGLFISIFTVSYSQDTIRLYLDQNYKKVEPQNALIERTAIIRNNKYFISDKTTDGRILQSGSYISINPLIEDGSFRYFDDQGKIQYVGKFINGFLCGNWYYPGKNNFDTLSFNDVYKYYISIDDSIILYNQILSKYKPKEDTLLINDIFKFIKNNFHLPKRCNKIYDLSKELKVDLILDTLGTVKYPLINNHELDLDNLIKYPAIDDSVSVDLQFEIYRILLLS